MRDRPRQIRITVQGDAIAKWAAIKGPIRHDKQPLAKETPFFISSANTPVYKDLPGMFEPLVLDIPYLGRDSYIVFVMKPGPQYRVEGLDTGQEIITAVCALQEWGIPIGEADKVLVEVE